MPYKLSLARKSSYLHAVVTGDNSRENVASYFDEIRRECIARNCFRVLIEERLEGPRLGATDIFRIVSDSGNRARGVLQAIAYVDLNAENGQMDFAETVAVNRGVPARVFPTVAAAEKWLLAGDRADA